MTISEIETKIKLKKISVENDLALNVMNPLKSNNHFTIFCGASGTGKTSLVINMLTLKGKTEDGSRKSYRKLYDRIYLFSGSMHTLPKEQFLDKLKQERVFNNLDNLQEVVDEIKASNDKCLIIFDDVVRELNDKKNKPILTEISFNRRHIGGGLSVWCIVQKLNKLGTFLRSNADSIYFWNWNNRKEVQSFYDEFVSTLDRSKFDEIIRYVAKDGKKHNFIYLDISTGIYHKNFNRLVIDDASN